MTLTFHGQRVLIWGGADKLFPFATHGRFYDALFKPIPSLFSPETPQEFLPDVGHIVPEEAPEAIAKVLVKVRSAIRP